MNQLINKLINTNNLETDEFVNLLNNYTLEDYNYIRNKAVLISQKYYNKDIYIRGLIEITNCCCNDCYYCGIRKSNDKAIRYTMSEDDILSSADIGYKLGFRTFVLQGGDIYNNDYDKQLAQTIYKIKCNYPDCAVTLSVGEKSTSTYQLFYNAGANRYLLRHETADEEHYKKLHPLSMSLINRKRCLYDLKEIGFQTGSGFMVGSPYQTNENIAHDLKFLKELNPAMIGIGPFIPHCDTPFKDCKSTDVTKTLFILAIIRIMFEDVLLPATTALKTILPDGHIQGILSGANVIMPNLSPADNRKNYSLYNNKACFMEESAEGLSLLENELQTIGYKINYGRGDHPSFIK